jgi:hypothetical protein
MPGLTSMDDLIDKMSSDGQTKRIDWNKNFLPTTAAVAGEWHSLFRSAGNPGADSVINTGTNLTFQQLKDTTTNGQTKRIDWNKNFLPTTAAVAGEWHSLFRSAGNPGADSVINTGTNLTFQQLKDTTTNATGIQHGGNVSPSYKNIVNASAFTAAVTTAPTLQEHLEHLLVRYVQ